MEIPREINTIGVDMLIMTYTEENSQMYRRQPDPSESKSTDANVQGKFMLSMRWKIGKKVVNQGIVTAIVSTLTAIPEVDLA
ncbi:hypothetical protein EDD16DRAFT_973734 [Pisolithus croceorrhizus]|nr:hypothetical protein EV401DRAFT_2079289 [Pisolithus croceorrhizus]KAI6118961.1 hypothetical protein EDD16DRAFT_973734 [Pisolithus croceorrhizus]KAI6163970.1 hypothetical protein EDD17DRAFT_406808 [Pisolithus thermaeus]